MTKSSRWKPQLHLMPPAGWLNDPNGLCQFRDLYHVFFQYCPGDALGNGSSGWGHYTSPDFIHWTFRGMPLKPDQSFDRDGVYSGSALIDGDTMRLFYTGNVKHRGNFDYTYSGRESTVVLVESPDGFTFREKIPLLDNAGYPDSCTCHVRDPKVWKDGSRYYMVLGARFKGNPAVNPPDASPADYGGVLLYQSQDGQHWNCCNTLTSPSAFGYMWECPDIVPLGTSRLLSVSPQGLARESHRFQNVYQSGYFSIEGDIEGDYTLSDFREWDMGFDFYAPQTFCDKQGRRILIGWMGLPDIGDEYENPTVQDGWQHILTIPRELSMNGNGDVCQRPVAELETLRRKKHPLENHGTCQIQTPFDLIVHPLCSGPADNPERDGAPDDIMITLYDSLKICCSPQRGECFMDFTSASPSDADTPNPGYGRTVRRTKARYTPEPIRIIGDSSAIEVFFGDGEAVMSTRIYPEPGIPASITIEGGTGILWEMDGLEVQ